MQQRIECGAGGIDHVSRKQHTTVAATFMVVVKVFFRQTIHGVVEIDVL
ncbi:MAG: hypothetical protein ACSLEN_00435 [Candidatus Malihini olakiniferum]